MPDPTSIALKLWVVLNRAVRSVEDALRRQVEGHGLSMTEFAVLEVLHTKGLLPVGGIGDRVLRTSGSMTYVVDKLEKRALLERKPCAEDQRATYIALTPEGRRLIGRIFPGHAAALERATAALSAEEKRGAIALLKKLGLGAAGDL